MSNECAACGVNCGQYPVRLGDLVFCPPHFRKAEERVHEYARHHHKTERGKTYYSGIGAVYLPTVAVANARDVARD